LANQVAELTKDRGFTYIVSYIKIYNIKKQILISNIDVFQECYPNSTIDFEQDFPRIIKNMIKKGRIYTSFKVKSNIDKYIVSSENYNHIRILGTPRKVYEKYYEKKTDINNKLLVSKPKYNEFNKDEIKAAIAYLVENGVVVWFVDYDEYTIYAPPTK
jgi:hypothetical protein